MDDVQAVERAAWIAAKVQNQLEVEQRNRHDAVAWVAFITGYPRSYVWECWRAHHYGGTMPV